MKRLLVIFLIVMGVAARAEDSYLYWMMSDDLKNAGTWDTLKISSGDGNYLTIYTDGGSFSDNLGESVDFSTYNEWAEYHAEFGHSGVLFAGLSGYSGSSSFVLELYSSEVLVAHSETIGYSALDGYITGNPIAVPSVPAYAFAPAAVPEPTSGVLVLVGGALLALRRKRKLIA